MMAGISLFVAPIDSNVKNMLHLLGFNILNVMIYKKIYYKLIIIINMVIKNKYSIAIVDIEKIKEINQVILKYATAVRQYSSYYYFDLRPIRAEDICMDITTFQLESENESDLDKKLNDLVEDLNKLNTGYALIDEDAKKMIVDIDHLMLLSIKFDNVKFIEEGTYEKIDKINHLKTDFGICKLYNPSFRPLENKSIANIRVEPELVYLFSDSEENLSKFKTIVVEKIMKINPDFEIEVKPLLYF